MKQKTQNFAKAAKKRLIALPTALFLLLVLIVSCHAEGGIRFAENGHAAVAAECNPKLAQFQAVYDILTPIVDPQGFGFAFAHFEDTFPSVPSCVTDFGWSGSGLFYNLPANDQYGKAPIDYVGSVNLALNVIQDITLTNETLQEIDALGVEGHFFALIPKPVVFFEYLYFKMPLPKLN